jgi:hypothetical protein
MHVAGKHCCVSGVLGVEQLLQSDERCSFGACRFDELRQHPLEREARQHLGIVYQQRSTLAFHAARLVAGGAQVDSERGIR